MKIVFFFIIAILSMATPGCSRDGATTPVENKNGNSDAEIRLLGEDDDPPIIIERTKKRDSAPVSSAMVVFYNATDTVQGFTNSNGELTVPLPSYGTWNIQVTHEDYHTVNEVVEITQPYSQRTDSLENK